MDVYSVSDWEHSSERKEGSRKKAKRRGWEKRTEIDFLMEIRMGCRRDVVMGQSMADQMGTG